MQTEIAKQEAVAARLKDESERLKGLAKGYEMFAEAAQRDAGRTPLPALQAEVLARVDWLWPALQSSTPSYPSDTEIYGMQQGVRHAAQAVAEMEDAFYAQTARDQETTMKPEYHKIALDALLEREVHYDAMSNRYRAFRLELTAHPDKPLVQIERELIEKIDEALKDDPKNAEYLAMKEGVKRASAHASTAIIATVPYTTWENK